MKISSEKKFEKKISKKFTKKVTSRKLQRALSMGTGRPLPFALHIYLSKVKHFFFHFFIRNAMMRMLPLDSLVEEGSKSLKI